MRYHEGIECGTDDSGIAHEWFVITSLASAHCLCLRCNRCGRLGAVYDPSAAEWSRTAGTNRPYRWRDDSRVKVFLQFADKALRGSL